MACTRAADLLILSGKLGGRNSWLEDIRGAFGLDDEEIEPGVAAYDGFSLRVERPDDFPEFPPRVELPAAPIGALSAIPPLAQPLPERTRAHIISATRLAEQLEVVLPGAGLRPVLEDSAQDGKGQGRASGRQIGGIVHRALAHWECLAYSDAQLDELLGVFARREGITASAQMQAVRDARRMLRRLQGRPVYADITGARRRHHELPFTLELAGRRVQGVIDLLFQREAGQWNILDWKTEWLGEDEPVPQEFLLQLAVYARAAEVVLGSRPRAGLCWLSPRLDVRWMDEAQLARVLEAFEAE